MRYILLLVVVLLLATGLWWLLRPAPLPPEPRPQAIDFPRVIELRNLANARLENGEYAGADPLYDELGRLLPKESLGFRNRLIGSLLTLQGLERSRQPGEFDAALADARRHLEQLRALEPRAMETWLLASRLSEAASDTEASVAELRTALEIAPDNPVLWYELAQRTRLDKSPAMQSTYLQSLGRAAELAPTNLFVLQHYLTALAAARDPALLQWLPKARTVVAEVAERVQRRTRYNPLTLLDHAAQAVEQQDWSQTLGDVRSMANILKPDDAAQSDRLRIELHSLELMVRRFQSVPEPTPTASPAVASEFTFVPLADAGPLSTMSGVLDAALGDFDLDDREELWVLRRQELEVYRHSGDATAWTIVTKSAVPEGYSRIVLTELDQDVVQTARPADVPEGQLPAVTHAADQDAVLFGPAGVLLVRNDDAAGGRQLAVVDASNVPPSQNVAQCRPVDFNSDGDLDLVLITSAGLRCWTNQGQGKFVEHSLGLQLPSAPTAVIDVDIDRDIDLDLVVGLGSGQIGYLENLRYGTFRWREIAPPAAESAPVVDIDVVDSDGNGSWDVVARQADRMTLTSSRWIEPGEVQFEASVPINNLASRGLLTGDFDNQGGLALVSWDQHDIHLAAADGRGHWNPSRMVTTTGGAGAVQRGLASDLDVDGDLDLVAVGDAGVAVLLNHTEPKGAWLEVGLVAQQVKGSQSAVSGRVNHYGLGSLLEVRSGSRYQAQVVRGGRTHFGLGVNQSPDAVRILWTNGIPENLVQPAARQYVCEKQTLKGSCPYLYTWNGAQFEFVTDLLWAAPIGLVSPAGSLVPCREWEHLLIPGQALQPVEGEYRLSLTEELWEAAYFDHVALTAVDHPAETAVFTNEKVGPPDLATPKLHAVSERRHPVRVQDQAGRDWSAAVAAADERYARPYERKLRQGYTEPTTLDLELGLEQRPERLTLFLTGWVYPTDTSINIGLSENLEIAGPSPPSISAPNAQGDWEEIIPYCGFPGGKTKTIAIDISGSQFPADDYRLRLSTSLELSWDEIFFTVNQPPVETRSMPLALLGADLRYRGFSAPLEHPDAGPERYDYGRVTTAPRWPTMGGSFTRYGEVTELLRSGDDRSVVMGSGDEMLVRFAAPDAPPPAGWMRDFILHNVGWDKDADLHTVYGQTVEPLPLRGMTGYPDPASDARWDAPDLQAYLQTYQTRTADRRLFSRNLMQERP